MMDKLWFRRFIYFVFDFKERHRMFKQFAFIILSSLRAVFCLLKYSSKFFGWGFARYIIHCFIKLFLNGFFFSFFISFLLSFFPSEMHHSLLLQCHSIRICKTYKTTIGCSILQHGAEFTSLPFLPSFLSLPILPFFYY